MDGKEAIIVEMKITISKVLNDIYQDWLIEQPPLNLDVMIEQILQSKNERKERL